MLVLELDRRHRLELERHLARSVCTNLFQLDLLEHDSKLARFFVAHDAQDLISATVVLVGGGRLAVPEGDPEGVSKVALELAERFDIQRIIGHETAATALHETLSIESPRLDRIHRLMQIRALAEGPPSTNRLEIASGADLEELLELGAAMHKEELGVDPRDEDPDAFERNVNSRIKKGRTFVIRAAEEIVFKADVGSDCSHGAQLEGVYTRPAWRGRGLATAGLGTIVQRLLARRARVTLHVYEQNQAAVRAYTKVGFQDAGRLRLISAI